MLSALSSHPVIQAVLAPFLVALLSAELLQRMRLSGLSIIAGFAITVYLVSAFTFPPLSVTHKIIWIGLGTGLFAIPVSQINWSILRPVLTLTSAGIIIWLTFHILLKHSTSTAIQWGIGCAFFVGWLVYWMDTLHDASVRAGCAGLALGLGTGMVIYVTGYEKLGKFDLALGSASAAYLFIMFVTNTHLSGGRNLTLPLSLIVGLTASVAVLTTSLPWYTLMVLGLIPLAARIPVSDQSPVWQQSTLISAVTIACAIVAVYISWHNYRLIFF